MIILTSARPSPKRRYTGLASLRGAVAAALFLSMVVAAEQGAGQPAPSGRIGISGLSVTYDSMSEDLSIRAHDIPLADVLVEVARVARVTIDTSSVGHLPDRVSLEFPATPLERALKLILNGFDSTLLFEAEESGAVPRLVRILVTSRRSARPRPEPDEPAAGITAEPGSVAVFDREQLLRAITQHDSAEVTAIARSLNDAGRDTERAQAVEVLLGLLDNDLGRNRWQEAIDALRELAPEQALTVLREWVKRSDLPTHVAAITGLGQLGDERAVDALAAALNLNDPATRQVSASALARIGGRRATEALISAYGAGDVRIKEAVAVAVAFHGDPTAQAALSRVARHNPSLTRAPEEEGANPNERQRYESPGK